MNREGHPPLASLAVFAEVGYVLTPKTDCPNGQSRWGSLYLNGPNQ